MGGGKANSRGAPQGGVISPLLSNCHLHLLDRIWEKHQLRWKLKARIVRYADNFVVLCAGRVDVPMNTVRQVLERQAGSHCQVLAGHGFASLLA